MTRPASVSPAWMVTLVCSVDAAVPATTQRAVNRALATVRVSTVPLSAMVVVALHATGVAAFQTVSLNVSVRVVFGNVNVAVLPVDGPMSMAGSPAAGTYAHW